MKVIAILVPVEGVTIRLKAHPDVVDPQIVVVVPDGIEVLPNPTDPSHPIPSLNDNLEVHDAAYIVKRLRKLRVRSAAAAINSIKAMFQFTTPLTDAAAKKRLDEARRKGLLTIDVGGRITFRDV